MSKKSTLSRTCPYCEKKNSFEVSAKKYKKFINGSPINIAFKKEKPNFRELIKSGICFSCWDMIFDFHTYI